MKTTTQFPVNSGTVVELTCSYSDAVFEGSSEVTCTSGTDFTFSEEPNCKIPGTSEEFEILAIFFRDIKTYTKTKYIKTKYTKTDYTKTK